MRKLVFLTVFVTLFIPAHAQTLREKVTRRAEQTSVEQARKTQIKKALQWEVFGALGKINWEGFLIENSVLQLPEGMGNIDALCQHLFDSDCELFTSLFLGDQQWQNTRPDYAQETSRVKYIYVSDASDHGTKTIPQEVAKLLKQIRRAHPQARILLALEFAVREDRHALPIHFAKETPLPFTIDADYAPLLKTTDKLNIDVLSLDDYLPDVQGATGFKIGNILMHDIDTPNSGEILAQYQPQLPRQIAQYEEQYIQLGKQITRLHQVLAQLKNNPQGVTPRLSANQLKGAINQFQSELDQTRRERQSCRQQLQELNQRKILYLHDFVSRSPWGMDQRNEQWARYLKALSPFYDIIITYAGNAHLSLPLTGAALLPKRMGEPFVLFDFYTQEQLKKEDEQSYELLNQIQAQENPGSGWWEEIEEDEMTQYCSEYAGQPLEQPADSSKPFFIKSVYPSAATAPGQDLQRRAVLQKYSADLEFTVPHTDFAVFLPDYSRRCLFK